MADWFKSYLLSLCLIGATFGHVTYLDSDDDDSLSDDHALYQSLVSASRQTRDVVDQSDDDFAVDPVDGRVSLSNSLGEDESLQQHFVGAHKAKSFLRNRRAWGNPIKKITGEEREEESESRAARDRERNRENLVRTCRNGCWGSWSAWSQCSKQCGSSGVRSRSRATSPASGCSGIIAAHGCPGPNSEQQACGRSCQNGGTLRANDCACPPAFKGTCCESRWTCQHPGQPTSGSVTLSHADRRYGTVATFSCNSGYDLVGSSTRTCQGSTGWSNSVPTCRLRSCGDPGAPANGQRQGSNFKVGGNVVYICNTGYTRQGAQSATCNANKRWSAPKPTCQVVNCGAPALPPNGWVRTQHGTTYAKVATFGCTSGYFIRGSASRTCQASGAWDGTASTCQRITCPALATPTNGSVTLSSSSRGSGTVATFSCVTGYTLQGNSQRTCLISSSGSQGRWSGSQPRCNIVDCGNPGNPRHGTRQGSVFTHQRTVTFACNPGYLMRGSSRTTCLANGRWSGSKPNCIACPRDQYKTDSSAASQCTECPANTHTVDEASNRLEQCLCDSDYKGPAGGPCVKKSCPVIQEGNIYETPGIVHSCNNEVGGTCHFRCNPGHVRSSGSSSLTCTPNERWSGDWPPECTACPRDTFKEGETSCTKCPTNTHSRRAQAARSMIDCVCDSGYRGPRGGPCRDVDECQQKNGGCEQACVNTRGSHHCECPQAGFVKDSENETRCVPKNQCPALQSPNNGGLVCLAVRRTNTERCSVKCNPGFEHIVRTNAYEECGPSTNWLWSHELEGSGILPCVLQFFPDVIMEAEVAYFVEQCDMLTDDMTAALREEFMTMLTDRGICVEEQQNVCDIDDVEINCGANVDEEDLDVRKRRSTNFDELRIKFKVKVQNVTQSQFNCTAECLHVEVMRGLCIQKCIRDFEANRTQILETQATKVRTIFEDIDIDIDREADGPREGRRGDSQPGMPERRPVSNLALRVGGLVLLPKQGFSSDNAVAACGQGMGRTNGLCAPCPAGSFLNSSECEVCPAGTYQPLSRQTTCLPCPTTVGTTSTGRTTCPERVVPEVGRGRNHDGAGSARGRIELVTRLPTDRFHDRIRLMTPPPMDRVREERIRIP